MTAADPAADPAGPFSPDDAAAPGTTEPAPARRGDCGCAPFAIEATETLQVAAGGDLQAAIDQARPGAEIVLEPGAIYSGNFTLPVKSGSGFITIRTAGKGVGSCERVTPARAPELARIVARGDLPAFRTLPGAHHYQLVGLEIAPQAGRYATASLVELGDGSEARELLPHDLVLDGLYIHGDAAAGGKRGVALNGQTVLIQSSWISDFKSKTQDSQAISGWNGAGSWTIANNYLSAAGENLLVGGTDPRIRDLVPADIAVRGNHFDKPRSWAREGWQVKNLLELKNARRVLIEGNVFENNWSAAQNGFAILFTPRNQNGGAPWTQVSELVFRRNLVRRVDAAVNILGHDDLAKSALTRDITIEDNRFEDVAGNLFQLGSGTGDEGPSDVTIDHNTGVQSGYFLLGVGRGAKPGLVFTHQLVMYGSGVFGQDANDLRSALANSFPGARLDANAVVGGQAALQTAMSGSVFPASLTSAPAELGAREELLEEASRCE